MVGRACPSAQAIAGAVADGIWLQTQLLRRAHTDGMGIPADIRTQCGPVTPVQFNHKRHQNKPIW